MFTVIEHMHFATIHYFFHWKLQDSKLKGRLENLFMHCCDATEKNKIVPHAFVCKEKRRTVRKRTKLRKCDHQVASFVTLHTMRKSFSCRQVYWENVHLSSPWWSQFQAHVSSVGRPFVAVVASDQQLGKLSAKVKLCSLPLSGQLL